MCKFDHNFKQFTYFLGYTYWLTEEIVKRERVGYEGNMYVKKKIDLMYYPHELRDLGSRFHSQISQIHVINTSGIVRLR